MDDLPDNRQSWNWSFHIYIYIQPECLYRGEKTVLLKKKKHYTTDYKSLKMELVTHAERLLKVSNIV